ncbi:MATE family efflux transporter [uncultured Endozoicomonas sp.]|uniref:MATE family efflux transporter n=1 Tax=uncultured Endozoicomonas sp. TaxID=432652 RepID=UPI0026252990|nr:MATE family efflux transporter [uncultured Endozoicomonas sp.]
MQNQSSTLHYLTAEAKALLLLSLPIIITQLATNGMTFVDTAMAGQASAADLAAIAVGSSLWLPASLLLRGTLMILTPVTAHHRGANNQKSISTDLAQTVWIALLSVLALAFYLNNGETILNYMKVAPEVVPTAVGYLNALAFGLPGIALFYTLNSFLEGMGNTRAPMVISVAGLLINIPVNYVLIYGKFGFPAMGAVGCGWATSLVYWLMSLLMFAYIRFHHRYAHLVDFKQMVPSTGRIKELLRLGLPIGISICMCGSIFAVIALLIGKLGASNIAAAQIALNFSSMTYMIPMSLSFGITIRVGFSLGQKNTWEAKQRAISGVITAIALAGISTACILLFRESIVDLYTTDPAIKQSAMFLLILAASYQISDALQASTSGALRGYKDTNMPMILSCGAYWGIALPMGYIFAMTDWITPALGTTGFWVGIITGLSLAALLLAIRLIKLVNKPIPV